METLNIPAQPFIFTVHDGTLEIEHPDIVQILVEILSNAAIGNIIGAPEHNSEWYLYEDKLPSTSGPAIAVIHTGGLAPNPKWLLDYPSVQILIRGPINDSRKARHKARQVKEYLLGFPSQTIYGDRLVAINALGDILNLGFDAENRLLLGFNLSIIMEPQNTDVTTNRQAL